MDELIAAYQWLRARLISDVTLAGLAPGGVYEGLAPVGTPTPYVVYQLINAEDVNAGLGVNRLLANILVQVTAFITGNQIGALGIVTSRVDDLLQGGSGTATNGGYIVGCIRERTLLLPPELDTDGRVLFRQGGGEYRLWTQAV